jgi:hypothetical protein
MSWPLSTLERTLRDAQVDHDVERRSAVEGVTARGLAEDNLRWERIGEAIAALARLIHQLCADSEFGEARPAVEGVAIRLSESIDDQVDVCAWRVIEAAARRRVRE